MSDPYKVLGISRDASDDEIKKAYRQLCRKYHPDANINNPDKDKAEEMFKLVQQGHSVTVYDQTLRKLRLWLPPPGKRPVHKTRPEPLWFRFLWDRLLRKRKQSDLAG